MNIITDDDFEGAAASKYKVSVSAVDLFDEKPPEAGFTGYISGSADALGRQLNL